MRAVHTLDPSPVQLATLDNWSVLRILRLAKDSLKRGRNLPVRMSAWIWALLARLDGETMNLKEVGAVRDFGKTALWMRLGFDEELSKASESLLELAGLEVEEEHLDQGADAVEDEQDQEVEMDISSEEEGEVSGSDIEANKGSHNKATGAGQGTKDIADPSSRKITLSTDTRRSDGRNADLFISDAEVSNSSHPKPRSKMEVLLGDNAAIAAAKVKLLSRVGQDDDAPVIEEGKAKTADLSRSSALEKVKVRTRTEEPLPSENTMATLDMIIVVIGEVFGQRDLLQFREAWTTSEMGANVANAVKNIFKVPEGEFDIGRVVKGKPES
jgi:hypothetical protein